MFSIRTLRDRSSKSGARARIVPSLAATAGIAGLFITAAVYAADPNAADDVLARRIAIGVCASCHGKHGESVHPKFPRLAGQQENYLAAQLRNFRAQSRGDPDALGYMWGMASQLNDATIDALAKYYSAQTVAPKAAGASAEVTQGREIYERGIASEGVPACAACHGADGHGSANFPRLAGQHSQYVLKQLRSFQSNLRNVAVMHGVALNLRPAEMQAVAAYLQTQP